MSDLITSAPVAGWYEDPYDDGQMRWWTGDEWSEHVAPMTAEAAAAAQAADETASRAYASESTAGADRADAAGAPPAHAETPADGVRVESERREAARAEAARAEAARAEAARVEAARVEAAQAEALRAEAARAEAARVEAAQAEALRAEAARAEAARLAQSQAAPAPTEPPRPATSEAADLLAQLAAAAAPSTEDDQPEYQDGRAVHDLGGEPVETGSGTRAGLRAARLAEQLRQQEQSQQQHSSPTADSRPEEPVLERVLPPGVAAADAAPATWSASSQAPSVSDLVIEPEIEVPAVRTASTLHEAAPIIATPITDETPVIASRRSMRDAAPVPELIITSEEAEAEPVDPAVSPTRPSREEHLASLMAAAEKQVELQRLAQAELQAEADRQRGEQLHGRTGGGGFAGAGVDAPGQVPADTGAATTALPSEAPESPVLVPASTSTEIARAGMVPLPGADDPFWSTAVVTPAATAVFSDEPKGAATLSSWLLALSPLLGVALILGAGVAAAVAAPAMTVPALGLAAVIAVLLPLAFVIADGRKLRGRGIATAPSALWWLLGSLVYLLVRAVRVRREGPRTWLPAALHVGASIVAAGAVVVGSMSFLAPVLSAVAEPIVASSMEQSLAADGETWQIDCDGRIPSFASGSEFTCPAVSGAEVGEVSGTFTDDRGAFSYRLTVQD